MVRSLQFTESEFKKYANEWLPQNFLGWTMSEYNSNSDYQCSYRLHPYTDPCRGVVFSLIRCVSEHSEAGNDHYTITNFDDIAIIAIISASACEVFYKFFDCLINGRNTHE